MHEQNITFSKCLMEFGVKKERGEERGRKDREEKESLKHMRHPSEDFSGFLSLVLTKPYFSEQGGETALE